MVHSSACEPDAVVTWCVVMAKPPAMTCLVDFEVEVRDPQVMVAPEGPGCLLPLVVSEAASCFGPPIVPGLFSVALVLVPQA